MSSKRQKQPVSKGKNDKRERQDPSPWGTVIELGPFKGPLAVLVLFSFGAVVGAVGTYFLSLQSDVLDRLVEIKVKETIEAQPTATPVPTYTPYPTPTSVAPTPTPTNNTNTPMPTSTPSPTPTPAVLQTEVVAIKTFHDRYVTAMNNQPGWNWELKAETETVDNWEKFDLLYLDNGRVALKTHHGRFVTATGNTGCCNILGAKTRDRGESEEFILEHLSGSKVALLTPHGYYVTAGDAGRCWLLRVETEVRGDWEEFKLIAQE